MSNLTAFFDTNQPASATLGTTAQGRDVKAHYFPGIGDDRALVLAGVHGSELSALEVGAHILQRLQSGLQPHYNTVLVPILFPDNAATAAAHPDKVDSEENIGRYSPDNTLDPNRQFPPLGRAYNPANPVDSKGRPIEHENRLLLDLIQHFKPSRIASLHAIHNPQQAGIFIDPISGVEGIALDNQAGIDLALDMARHAEPLGADIPANHLDSTPSAWYPNDLPFAPSGEPQPRYTENGISLGGWGSTAVADPDLPQYNRPPMQIITIEAATCRRSMDYPTPEEQQARRLDLQAIGEAVLHVFLGVDE